MSKLTNAEINAALSALRKDLRDGNATIYTRSENSNFASVVTAYVFDGGEVDWSRMNPQTKRRFDTLFSTVPSVAKSQDEIAWALQNFMNRRADPWSHVRNRMAQDEITGQVLGQSV